jgi:hypothetical protein
LKKVPRQPPTPTPTNATIIITKTKEDEEQNDESSEEGEDDENSEEPQDDDKGSSSDDSEAKTKNQHGDVASMLDLHPPYGMNRNGRSVKSKTAKKGKRIKQQQVRDITYCSLNFTRQSLLQS